MENNLNNPLIVSSLKIKKLYSFQKSAETEKFASEIYTEN